MNDFERVSFLPPPLTAFSVVSRYGKQGERYKVMIFGKTKIMTREQVIEWINEAKKTGRPLYLNGFR